MKEKTVKRNAIKKVLSIVLALAMIIALMPSSNMMVYAESVSFNQIARTSIDISSKTAYDSPITVSWVNGYTPKFGDTFDTVKSNLVLSDSGDNGKLNYTCYLADSNENIISDGNTQLTEDMYLFAAVVTIKDNTQYKFKATEETSNNLYRIYGGSVTVFGQVDTGWVIGDYVYEEDFGTISIDDHEKDDGLVVGGQFTVSSNTPPHTHSGTKVKGQAATCTSDGWNDYYQCTDTECNKNFSDSDCTREITDLTAWKKTTGIKAPTGHDFTGEYKVTKEATATADGKMETSCKNGCGTKKVVVIPAGGSREEDPTNGKLSKDAEVASDAPVESASLDNSKRNLMEASGIFTEEEKTAIANGDDAKVYLSIENLNEAEVPAESKTNITTVAQKELGNNATIKYMDVSLIKQIGNKPAEKVSEPGTTINVTIEIPTSLRNKETGKYRKYRIIREHDGKVTVIKGKFNSATGEYSFGTDAFSTYAIAYEDATMDIDLGQTPTERIFDKLGDTFQITASVTPAEAEQKLIYESSNPAVATVDENGLVTAAGSGTAVITIKNTDSSVSKTITVTVIDTYGNEIAINAGLKVSQAKKSLGVNWGKVAGADGYMVYAAYCGTKLTDIPVKTTKKTSVAITKLDGKKINQNKNIKVYVKAYKIIDGKKVVLGNSITAYVAGTKNKRYTNVKSVKITSKTKLSLAVGKTSRIKAKVILVNKKRKQLSDAYAATFRYASSDIKVATVTTEGKIKAVGAGTCYVYVYAKNGYAKKVKVTVK